ncbi:MAG: hypothetical protein AB8B72_01510 [Crocinitomicaceae bacterium]
MRRLLMILITILTSLTVIAQPSSHECDSIYEFAEEMPVYQNGMNGLIKYLKSDLIPILVDCNGRDGILTSSLYLSLTIDRQGKVIDVEFQRIQATEQCKKELREKLLTMKGWTSGMQDGIAICCTFSWPISGINWR